jgi:hypothetical protein
LIDPLTRDCDTCRSTAGLRCKTSTGSFTSTAHAARRAAAHEAARDQLDPAVVALALTAEERDLLARLVAHGGEMVLGSHYRFQILKDRGDRRRGAIAVPERLISAWRRTGLLAPVRRSMRTYLVITRFGQAVIDALAPKAA